VAHKPTHRKGRDVWGTRPPNLHFPVTVFVGMGIQFALIALLQMAIVARLRHAVSGAVSG